MAFAGAVVENPTGLAARLAKLFGTEVTFSHPDALLGAPQAGVSLADNTLALYPLPEHKSFELWGMEHVAPRVHVLGVMVPELTAAVHALEVLEIATVRADEHTLVLRPEATGFVPLVVTDELLPGDPRLTEG